MATTPTLASWQDGVLKETFSVFLRSVRVEEVDEGQTITGNRSLSAWRKLVKQTKAKAYLEQFLDLQGESPKLCITTGTSNLEFKIRTVGHQVACHQY